MGEEKMVPKWLSSLLSEKFYENCVVHHDVFKNEKNIFCVDCCVGFCTHCVGPHGTHRLLQIRRYVYHDVIRVKDAEKLMDCANIQSNFTNGAYVVFLNPRPQTRCKPLKNCCIWCQRGVQESNLYCSIFCKINHIISEGLLSKCVYDYEEELAMPEQDGLMTPDSVLEVPIRTSSSSSASYGFIDCRTLACTATTEIVRKKRTSRPKPKTREVTACVSVISPPPEFAGNRRKSVPCRSPFY
ncbi:PLATZ transcription factor family protein [Artemisia annua]|uniref:PLATZ transcription factor family protein n=1 Tax=Artemisia annua TaxID=35608 RepID=A0A2U1N4W8_ARTAN|nr:PLATZ transcription factor family protein [Artemisia annua]